MKKIFVTLFFLSCLAAFLICPATLKALKKPISIEIAMPSYTPVPLSTVAPSPTPTSNPYQIWDDTSLLRSSGIYTYQILNEAEKQAVIREIHAVETTLTIPYALDGYKIIGVGIKGPVDDYYYDGYSSYRPDVSERLKDTLKTLTISEGIQYIGTSAFSDCKNLTTVNLPKNLYSIENSAFSGCSSLKKIRIQENKYMNPPQICDQAFANCISLEEVKLETEPLFGENPFHSSHIQKLSLSQKNPGTFYLNIDWADVNQISVDSSIQKMIFEGIGWYANINKIIVNNKKTKIELWSSGFKLGSLCTVPKANCITWAKKYRLPYKIKSCGKMGKLTHKKGKVSWKKVKTNVRTYKYSRFYGWVNSTGKVRTYYKVYGKNSKKAKYKLIKTTTRTSCKASYKYMKVTPVATW